jgi:hypothetical protein
MMPETSSQAWLGVFEMLPPPFWGGDEAIDGEGA